MSPRSQASHALRTTSTLSSDFATPSGRERASPCWGITSTLSRDIAPPVSAAPHVVSRIGRKPKEERGGATCSESFFGLAPHLPAGQGVGPRLCGRFERWEAPFPVKTLTGRVGGSQELQVPLRSI